MTDPNPHPTVTASAARVQADLDRLLKERSQLRALLDLDVAADHAGSVTKALQRVDGELGQLLSTWRLAGGRIVLTGDHGPVPVPTSQRRSADASPVITRPRRGVEPLTSDSRTDVDNDWREAFGQLMGRLGPGQDLAGEIDIVVEAAVGCDRWSRWPKHVQRHLVGLLACRLRALQDEQGVPEYELQDGFSALTRFSKRVKPGFVFGLSRSHRPQHGPSWDDDAVRHWDQLAALVPGSLDLTDEQDALLEKLGFLTAELDSAPSDDARETVRSQAVRLLAETLEAGVDAREPSLVSLAVGLQPLPDDRMFKRLNRAVQDASAPAEDADDGLDIDADWGWWIHTRGRRGLILGGEPREATRARLERAFGMASLRWTDEASGRRLIASSDVDILFVLEPYLSDSYESDLLPLARARSIPFVHVDHGTSVALLKSAIERFTEREGEATL